MDTVIMPGIVAVFVTGPAVCVYNFHLFLWSYCGFSCLMRAMASIKFALQHHHVYIIKCSKYPKCADDISWIPASATQISSCIINLRTMLQFSGKEVIALPATTPQCLPSLRRVRDYNILEKSKRRLSR
mmetsp:Transcript_14510/g.22364  ORF Transcript_14510/g.22364 Transcript_14510/m.22364 type:complete len:129 (+) Transcript_14510:464-850(+)